MNDEELSKLKETKAACYQRIIELKEDELSARQTLYLLEDKLNKARIEYEKLDYIIAMEEKLTICEPSGTGIKKKQKPAVKISKEEAINLISEMFK